MLSIRCSLFTFAKRNRDSFLRKMLMGYSNQKLTPSICCLGVMKPLWLFIYQGILNHSASLENRLSRNILADYGIDFSWDSPVLWAQWIDVSSRPMHCYWKYVGCKAFVPEHNREQVIWCRPYWQCKCNVLRKRFRLLVFMRWIEKNS